MLRSPSQYFRGIARSGYQHGRISSAARPLAKWYGARRNLPHGVDNLAHGISMASSEVQRAALATSGKVFQRPHVGVAEVSDVDIIA
jgi:hypothetical protein